jgi:hypothetical protein
MKVKSSSTGLEARSAAKRERKDAAFILKEVSPQDAPVKGFDAVRPGYRGSL